MRYNYVKKNLPSFAQTSAPFAVKKRCAKISVLLIFFCAISVSAFCQREQLSEKITQIAEDLAGEEDDPEAVSIFIGRLHELAENPIKVNSSDESELSRLFFLSDFQVKALADYTRKSGKIVSAYELAAIPGFDRETVEMIVPFITLAIEFSDNSDSVRWNNLIISNLSVKSGSHDTSFLGSPLKAMTRYRFTAGRLSGGITMEKDPGEKILTGSPPMPDFFSFHLSYSGPGVIRKIIIGDFSARFGQGSNINTSTRLGMSLTSTGYMSARDEIKPYTSTEENRFFRGMAAGFSIKKIDLIMFLSKNYSDATLGSVSGSSADYVESLYSGGVHNTSSLLIKKDALLETVYGLSASYNFNNLKIGLSWSGTGHSLPFMVNNNDPETIFNFRGVFDNIVSVNYNSLVKNILLYGELSLNDQKKYAAIQGISLRPSDRLLIGFMYRIYNPGFITFYGNAPGTGSKTTNESGIMGTFSFEAAKHLFISGGCDIHSFPWLKYRCSAPSYGIKQEIKISFLPSEKLTIDASYFYRMSMLDISESSGVPHQDENTSRSFKISSRYSVSDNLYVGSRIDYKIIRPGVSKGFLLSEEINYSFRKIPVMLWARYCLFNTNDWSSRIYTYENDLLYSFSIPALSGEGSRNYLMLQWKVAKSIELRIKYGSNSIAGNLNKVMNTDELKMQIRIRF
jgi:hypothetical protein